MKLRTAKRSLGSALLMLLMGAVCHAAAEAPQDEPAKPKNHWEKQIQQFEQADAKNPPPKDAVLFIGSSSVRAWHRRLDQDFPGMPLIKRGFGGSRMSDVVFFMDRIVIPYRPSKIVLYCGENDIAGKQSPQSVLEHWKKFADHVHAKLPETKIWYIAMKPSPARWTLWPKFVEGNQAIAKDCKQRDYAQYIAIDKVMLGEDGKPRPDIWRKNDKLHMGDKGYDLWTKVVRKAIGYKPPAKSHHGSTGDTEGEKN